MNKQEWKLQHAANRRMYNGLFSPIAHGERNLTSNENFNIAAKMFWNLIERMHPSFLYAMQKNDKVSYPIIENRWAVRHNSTCFNENRGYN